MGFRQGVKKHPVFSGAAILLFLLSLWVSYFIVTFDLNDYRKQLQKTLSTHLALPVHLGNAKLKLRDAGLAVSFSSVTIGDETTSISVQTSELWLLLEWPALLRQKPGFSKIGMLQPQVRLTLSPRSEEGETGGDVYQPFLIIHGALLNDFSVKALEIREGRLQLFSADATGDSPVFELNRIQAHLTDLARGQTVGINLTAGLPADGKAAALNLKGDLEVPDDLLAWPNSALDLAVDLKNLTDKTLKRLPFFSSPDAHFTGTADLSCQFSGTLKEGLSLGIKLSGNDFAVAAGSLPVAYPVRHLAISGLFRLENHQVRLENMVIGLNGMQLTGESVGLAGPTGTRLQVELSGGTLPVGNLAELLPAGDDLPSLAESEGTFWIEKGDIALVLNADDGRVVSVEQFEVDASVGDLTWQVHPDLRVLIHRAELRGSKGHWIITRGKGSLGPIPVTLGGEVDLFAEPTSTFDLRLEGSAALADLPPVPNDLPAALPDFKGSFSFLAHVNRDAGHINLDVDADLSKIEMIFRDNLHLPSEPGSRLNLHGSLQGQTLEIGHVKLERQNFGVTASGRINWSQQTEIDMLGLVELSQAAELEVLFPELEPYDVSGQAKLEFTLEGQLAAPRHTAMLILEDIGFSTRGATAPISQLQGRLQLTDNGFDSEKLLARIGESAVAFKARLKDFSEPELLLDIQADKIKASDLIFPSDQTELFNLRGQVRITPDKVAFAPVQARLPEGTLARVQGEVTVTPNLHVDLAIASQFADVDEIIGLWTRISPERRQEMADKREMRQDRTPQPHRVQIQAQVEQGDLYGMRFKDAAATIVHKPGQLLIHPLDFQVDEGHATAQVIVDFKKSRPPLLRVSGHAENVDAYRIYNELLDQNSILRGSLRGDFYLQGEVGENYLPSSFGSFDIEIRDGVLRKFHVLSKIFSLLNVAQIFSLELPDMNAEGMPYDSIVSSLTMNKGVLSTESLLVKSEAMNQSYIGQLDLVENEVDLTVAVQPLGTVDKILSRIPVAGWLLTGKEKALITTHFSVRGKLTNPNVGIEPVTSISEKTFGLIRRTLGLPMKLITEPSEVLGVPGKEE